MILDYETCQKIMDSYKGIITEREPIGWTANEKLPIRHFTLGSGKTSSSNRWPTCQWNNNSNLYHRTNELLIKNNIVFEDLTIHFIPMLNPEGYVVISSAIKEKLGKIVLIVKNKVLLWLL